VNPLTLDLRLGAGLELQLSSGGRPLASAAPDVQDHGRSLLGRDAAQAEAFKPDGASVVYAVGSGRLLRADLRLLSLGRTDAVRLQWTFTNIGQKGITLDRLAAPTLHLDRRAFPLRRLWTMQGAAVKWGQDFAFPLSPGFARDNFLGHLQDAEGGGSPVVDFWNEQYGLALMQIDPQPRDWYMPVTAGEQDVACALELRRRVELRPGESLTCPAVTSPRRLLRAAGALPRSPRRAGCSLAAAGSRGLRAGLVLVGIRV
jgi:hypothetical protein